MFQENGNGEMGLFGIPLGAKNKYKKMNSEVPDDNDDVLHQQQRENKRNSTRKYVIACAIFASLNNVLLGYDVGVMSGIIIFIKEDPKISEVQVEFLIGILSIVSLLGGLTMTLAPSYAVLMAGRLLVGIGIVYYSPEILQATVVQVAFYFHIQS